MSFPCCLLVEHGFKGPKRVEGQVRQLDSHATREGVILPCGSLHSQVRLGPMLQPVHPESVLCGGVSQHHVGVVEHVESIQSEGVNFELIQRKLGVCVKADVSHPGQRVGQLFGQAWRRLSSHCEDDVGDVAMATVSQLLGVLQAAAGQPHHGGLCVVECGALVEQAGGADGALNHVELLQLVRERVGLP